MHRELKRELLDDLPADDPRAIGSRNDLRRLNALMGHAGIISAAYFKLSANRSPKKIVELGAGDGVFMSRLAPKLPLAAPVDLQLVDQQRIVAPETVQELAARGCRGVAVQADVFEYLSRPVTTREDLMIANLFLHHFTEEQLRTLLARAAEQTDLFIACEPRRAKFPLFMTKLIGLIGCNTVTRHDASVSVRAGFRDEELSRLWPSGKGWNLHEYPAGLFSHCFAAQRI